MPMKPQTWAHITECATDESQVRTYKDKVAFHYFNPHGLYARKQAVDSAIDAAVARKRCNSGAMSDHRPQVSRPAIRINTALSAFRYVDRNKGMVGVLFDWQAEFHSFKHRATKIVCARHAGFYGWKLRSDLAERGRIAERRARRENEARALAAVRGAWQWPIPDGSHVVRANSPDHIILLFWERNAHDELSVYDIMECPTVEIAREILCHPGAAIEVGQPGMVTVDAADWYKEPANQEPAPKRRRPAVSAGNGAAVRW